MSLDLQIKAVAERSAQVDNHIHDNVIGVRSGLATTDQTSIVNAINELHGEVDALGTTEFTAADITARDALTGLTVGDKVFVTDASTEADVASGWAIYRVQSTGPVVFTKVAEQESLDVAIVANLSLGTIDGTTVGVDIDTGTDVTLPSATATDAGVMPAADKVKVDFVSVTQAVDLDELEAESAALVSLSGVASDDTTLGAMSANNIADNLTVKAALQDLDGDIGDADRDFVADFNAVLNFTV